MSSNYSAAATQELSHVDAFHAQVVRVIQDYRATGKEVPEGMQAVYDREHEKMIDRVSRIKMLLELARKYPCVIRVQFIGFCRSYNVRVTNIMYLYRNLKSIGNKRKTQEPLRLLGFLFG